MPHRTPLRTMRDAAHQVDRSACRLSVASLAGRHARVNQDSHACRAPDFFAVADGVGGGSLGEVASAMLVQQLGHLHAPQPEQVTQALHAADQAIAQRIAAHGTGPGAAVCAAVWSLEPSSATWLAMTVGDCQVRVLARDEAGWQARWASPLQTYAAAGLPPPPGVPAHAPANMVGCGMALPAQFHVLSLVPGERLLLCSDGFNPKLLDQDGPNGWRHSPSPLPSDTAERWCEQAQRAGAQDDVTVILVEPAIAVVAQRRCWRWALIGFGMLGLGWLLPWAWR